MVHPPGLLRQFGIDVSNTLRCMPFAPSRAHVRAQLRRYDGAVAVRQMSGLLLQWWREGDHFDQLSSHLEARGMTRAIRARVSFIAGSLSLVAIGSIWSPVGPHGTVPIALALIAGVCAAANALLWALRWPTRRQATGFAIASSTGIALVVLAQSNPAAAMLGCTTFTGLAIHQSLFHSARVIAYNFCCALVVASVKTVGLVAQFGLAGALVAFWLVVLLNISAPLALYVAGQILGPDAYRADRDSLTGLFNRRAFYLHSQRILQECAGRATDLVIAVIDLDRFKQLNDRYGHATGDAALVSVAQTLRDGTGEKAVIGRLGGEEFAFADEWPPGEVAERAQRLCTAIAELPFGITASIGTTTFRVEGATPQADIDTVLADLVSLADAAMYSAKGKGGNQAGHHRRTGDQDPAPVDQDGSA